MKPLLWKEMRQLCAWIFSGFLCAGSVELCTRGPHGESCGVYGVLRVQELRPGTLVVGGRVPGTEADAAATFESVRFNTSFQRPGRAA